ncbi:MAG: metallophosphoesterase [Anaerolineae bacterium]|jgi:hypothetical protein|nr:metallophosphoesterase [Anaerolineae bacterium]MBT3714055.1 metallophosphoesterase [Anaerolineae bacterium]MBT4310780.1 metallophosphoesterase [Anaerolineae bacterium]MBT4458222.1 metallophosphoesterase [Anaerolineae bacterium]MBT4841023.1 metallophosphoesterase [Anaerolineae bacterium]
MKSKEKRKLRLTRRDFLKLIGRIGAFGLATGLGGWTYATKIEPSQLDLVKLPLFLPRLAPVFDGLRVAIISDIHLGGWMTRERLIPVIDMILEQSPDIILITGDFMYGHGWSDETQIHADDLAAELLRLSEKITTLAVMGNHDYWTSAPDVRRALKKANVIELSNTFYSMTRGTEQLHFCSVDDIWEEQDDLDSLLMQLPAEEAAILMAHEPDFADISAATRRFDLQISGHTHGGQVVFPDQPPPVLPYLGQKYPSGLYEVEKMWQYTNRGVGMGRISVRFNCPPEITILTLKTTL